MPQTVIQRTAWLSGFTETCYIKVKGFEPRPVICIPLYPSWANAVTLYNAWIL